MNFQTNHQLKSKPKIVVIRNAASNINDMRVPNQKLSKSTVHHNRNVNSMQSYGRYWNDVMSHENFEAELY